MRRRLAQALIILSLLLSSAGTGAAIALGTRGEPGGVRVVDPILHCYPVWYNDLGLAGVLCSWRPARRGL